MTAASKSGESTRVIWDIHCGVENEPDSHRNVLPQASISHVRVRNAAYQILVSVPNPSVLVLSQPYTLLVFQSSALRYIANILYRVRVRW